MIINSPFISGSTTITGNLTVSGSISGVISGSVDNAVSSSYALNATNAVSASYALNANTASYAINSTTASFANNATSASYAINATTSSYALNATNAISAVSAQTASYADNFTVAGTITAQKINVQQITSSVVYSSGSNVFGNSLSNTQVMTGSVSITGSLAVNGTGTFNGDITINKSAAQLIIASTNSYGVLAFTNNATGGNIVVNNTPLMDIQCGTVKFTDSTGANERMRIISSGNVGINTTTPSYTLDVNGTVRFRGDALYIYDTGNIEIGRDTTFSTPYMTVGFGGRSNGFNRIYGARDTSDGIFISAATGRGINLLTNGNTVNALTITSAGAATFSSSVTAGGLVTINKINEGLILTAGANTDASYMSTRANNSTGWMIIGSQGSAGNYIQTGTGANESAITTVGFYALALGTNQTERMRITASGRVLIGTPPPTESTYQLDVNGTGRFSGAVQMASNSQVIGGGLLKLGIATGNQGAALQLLGWAGVNKNWQIDTAYTGDDSLNFVPSTTAGGSTFGTAVFKLTSTGAATFSSSVASVQYNISNVGGKFSGEGGATNYLGIYKDDGTPIFRVVSNGSGAATFSGDVVIGTKSVQKETSSTVSAGAATTVYTMSVSGNGGALVTVTGVTAAGNWFYDVVSFNAFNSATAISSHGGGSPPSRTYSVSSSSLQVTVATALTAVKTLGIETHY